MITLVERWSSSVPAGCRHNISWTITSCSCKNFLKREKKKIKKKEITGNVCDDGVDAASFTWVIFCIFYPNLFSCNKCKCGLLNFYRYLKGTLDQYVESDYTLIYFHHGLTSENKPSLSWLREAYREFDRKWAQCPKNLHLSDVCKL